MFFPETPTGSVYSVMGRVPMVLVIHAFIILLSLWLLGWALLWGERKTPRGKTFIVGSWAVPCSIVYVWVSLPVLTVAGIGGTALALVALIPPAVISIAVPQLFVADFLRGKDTMFSKACVAVGSGTIIVWASSAAIGETALMLVEALLPLYFGLLVIEYLRVHTRINGPGF
jgi:hypothetical protein